MELGSDGKEEDSQFEANSLEGMEQSDMQEEDEEEVAGVCA